MVQCRAGSSQTPNHGHRCQCGRLRHCRHGDLGMLGALFAVRLVRWRAICASSICACRRAPDRRGKGVRERLATRGRRAVREPPAAPIDLAPRTGEPSMGPPATVGVVTRAASSGSKSSASRVSTGARPDPRRAHGRRLDKADRRLSRGTRFCRNSAGPEGLSPFDSTAGVGRAHVACECPERPGSVAPSWKRSRHEPTASSKVGPPVRLGHDWHHGRTSRRVHDDRGRGPSAEALSAKDVIGLQRIRRLLGRQRVLERNFARRDHIGGLGFDPKVTFFQRVQTKPSELER